ncbi:MAG TPA: alpha/beta hydrolase [Acidimicrobiales bacterium]|nr:alpha/beta hydrolase [Acidimicrobiales bacterium]
MHLPDGAGPHPVIVVLHGGFWRARYGRWIMRALAEDLARRGYAAWNLEYRRVGPLAGGGVPHTLDDVAAGLDHLARLAEPNNLDLDRVAVVGHSAGGHLALWLAGYHGAIEPLIYIAQAGVADLRMAYDMGLGDGIVESFLGGRPDAVPDHYAAASPIERLPTGRRVALIHGTADTNVPIDVARSYHRAARAAGDDAEMIERDCDHMVLIDHHSAEWQLVVDRLP